MTTQAIKVSLVTPDLTILYQATATDDAWGELVDETNSLSLGRVQPGSTIYALTGYYTAGAAIIRIRNLKSRDVKEFLPLPIITEEKIMYLERPIRVDIDDVIEVFPVAVPT